MLRLPEGAEAQEKFQQTMRSCLDCHQLGNKATRELSAAAKEGTTTTLEAWDKRTKFGPSGGGMSNDFQRLGEARRAFADWTDSIVKGEVPRTSPSRPTGVQRNLVLTLWDWGSPQDGRADNAASDKRRFYDGPTATRQGSVRGHRQHARITTGCSQSRANGNQKTDQKCRGCGNHDNPCIYTRG